MTEPESDVWRTIPEELVVRMVDIVTAVSQGHDSIFLLAEATHVLKALDELWMPVVTLDFTNDEDGIDD